MFIVEEKERELRTKKISVALIVLATLFSQVVLFKFDFTNDVEYDGVWLHHFLPLLHIGDKFNQVIVTTAGVGYVLFLIFFIMHYKKAKQNHSRFITVGIVVCTYVLLHEFFIYAKAWFQNFTPYPIFTGIPLLIISIEVFNAVYSNKE